MLHDIWSGNDRRADGHFKKLLVMTGGPIFDMTVNRNR